jgi:hypothetical protein
MTAHAVGDDVQAVLVETAEGVLVVIALKPDVCQPCRRNAHSFWLRLSVPPESAGTLRLGRK